tara:strand:+ start:568 stop:921 length:354 start_codon:yes stop_codon:yes gene_type:complete
MTEIEFKVEALKLLCPKGFADNGVEITLPLGSLDTVPSQKAIDEKITELKNAEPMRLLRQERNWKLAETDWWCASDRTPTKAQLDYRKSLRDLPSTAKPKLDENGQLTGVTWPTKPE